MVLEIIIIKFSCILIMMSRNAFPEPQRDSASYISQMVLVCLSNARCPAVSGLLPAPPFTMEMVQARKLVTAHRKWCQPKFAATDKRDFAPKLAARIKWPAAKRCRAEVATRQK